MNNENFLHYALNLWSRSFGNVQKIRDKLFNWFQHIIISHFDCINCFSSFIVLCVVKVWQIFIQQCCKNVNVPGERHKNDNLVTFCLLFLATSSVCLFLSKQAPKNIKLKSKRNGFG